MQNQQINGSFKNFTPAIGYFPSGYYGTKQMQNPNLANNLKVELGWVTFCEKNNIPTIQAPELGGIVAILDQNTMYVADQKIIKPSSLTNPAIICSHFNDSLCSWLHIQTWLSQASKKNKVLFSTILKDKIKDIQKKANLNKIILSFDAFAVIFNPNLDINEQNPKLIVMDFDLVTVATKNFAIIKAYNYINAIFYLHILRNPSLKHIFDLLPNKSANNQFLASVLSFALKVLFQTLDKK